MGKKLDKATKKFQKAATNYLSELHNCGITEDKLFELYRLYELKQNAYVRVLTVQKKSKTNIKTLLKRGNKYNV